MYFYQDGLLFSPWWKRSKVIKLSLGGWLIPPLQSWEWFPDRCLDLTSVMGNLDTLYVQQSDQLRCAEFHIVELTWKSSWLPKWLLGS
jgi:hypothetical protein